MSQFRYGRFSKEASKEDAHRLPSVGNRTSFHGRPSSTSIRPATASLSKSKDTTVNALTKAFSEMRVGATAASAARDRSRLTLSSNPRSRRLAGRTFGQLPVNPTLEDIAFMLRQQRFRNIVIMAGAGISTPSGIPDFRTPGTGLYDNLKKYRIPYPTAIFDIDYFHVNPRPFFCLAKELYPGNYKPNYVHFFFKLLEEKGLLLRSWTQNIDGLERMAGLSGSKLVEAHGNFATASCVRCGRMQDPIKVKTTISEDKIPRCDCSKKGICKPDIVFFGEDLPPRFYSLRRKDFIACDLLFVMGTSLEVEPFCQLVNGVRFNIPRVLINRDVVDPFTKRKKRPMDVVCTGDIVESVKNLVDSAGWAKDMEQLLTAEENGGKELKPA
eukprot:m.66298 g.66298  ORF g.66298 m.66298 type:complete len:384 (+) comp35380_c0_seq4:259-1410(+)